MLNISEEANVLGRITINPEVCHGKPTIRGLRYPVEMILELLSAGMTYDELLADYEDLERQDIFAALAYAHRLSQIKRLRAVGCMKFLVDAHLPRRLAVSLIAAGHDAVHTLDLPNANRTSDGQIIIVAAREQRVVITKDADFVSSHLLNGQPEKLLLISTGNITSSDLEALILPNLAAIVVSFAVANSIEMSRTALIIHS